MNVRPPIFLIWLALAPMAIAEPLPLSKEFWNDPSFVRSFLGAYQPNNRIEPFITEDEREVLQSMQALMRDGKRSTAISRLSSNKLTDASAALKLNLGNLLFEYGKWQEAASAYEHALKEYPDFRRAHAGLGFALVRLEKLDEALPHLQRAFALGDQSAAVCGLLGHCLMHQNKTHSALFAYQRAQLTEPDQLDWKLGEAQCLHAANEHAKAVAIFAEVLAGNPEQSAAWLHYAQALISAKRYEDAAAALELSDRLTPLLASDLKTLGDLYLQLGVNDWALERYRNALQATPPLPADSAVACVNAMAQQRQWTSAKTLISLIESVDNIRTSATATQTLARLSALIEMETGDPKLAAEKLTALLAQHPMDGDALILLAGYRWSQKAQIEADILFEQAKLVAECEGRACIAHARLQVESFEFDKASKNLNRALELEPSEALTDYAEQVAKAARSTAPL